MFGFLLQVWFQVSGIKQPVSSPPSLHHSNIHLWLLTMETYMFVFSPWKHTTRLITIGTHSVLITIETYILFSTPWKHTTCLITLETHLVFVVCASLCVCVCVCVCPCISITSTLYQLLSPKPDLRPLRVITYFLSVE